MSNDLSELYAAWKEKPTPDNLNAILKAADPLLTSHISKLTGSVNPAVKTQAKVLAVKAVKTYDPSKGATLITHMANQVQPIIRTATQYDRPLAAPERALQDWKSVQKAEEELVDLWGRTPSTQEIADHMGLSIKRIADVRGSARGVMSEGQVLEGEALPTAKESKLSLAAEYIYPELTPTEQLIYEMKTGYGGRQESSNDEIATQLKISPSAVSQKCADIGKRISEAETMI